MGTAEGDFRDQSGAGGGSRTNRLRVVVEDEHQYAGGYHAGGYHAAGHDSAE
jgi:hypothetical protein